MSLLAVGDCKWRLFPPPNPSAGQVKGTGEGDEGANEVAEDVDIAMKMEARLSAYQYLEQE